MPLSQQYWDLNRTPINIRSHTYYIPEQECYNVSNSYNIFYLTNKFPNPSSVIGEQSYKYEVGVGL